MQGLNQPFLRYIRNAIIISVVVSCLAVIVNFIHPNRIPLISEKPYETLVPCPDSTGHIEEVSYSEIKGRLNEALVIDARAAEDFDKWHIDGSINIPYDYLSPVCPLKIKEIIKSKKKYVVVYGDGEEPDSGRELAKELATRGVKNVHYIRGGIKEIER